MFPVGPIFTDRRRWYQSKRTYAVVAMALALICALVVAWLLVYRLDKVVRKALELTRAPVVVGEASWDGRGALVLRGIGLGKGAHEQGAQSVYASIERLRLRWGWVELLVAGRIASVELHKPQIWVGRVNASLGQSGDKARSWQGLGNWSIDSLKIDNATLMLDNLGEDIPPVPITIGRDVPVEFTNVRLTGRGVGMDREQVATVEKLTITSPYDPTSPVLRFEAINLTFSWEALRRSEIERIELVGPVIYLGPDLFWFADAFSKKRPNATRTSAGAPTNPKSATVPWKIHDLQVRAGQLAINAYGQPGVTLPFTFVSSASNIRLDELDKITLNNKIIIPPQDRFYPDYKVHWKDMSGEIAFSLPLSDKSASNVVNTIHVKSISWNDLAVTNAWSSVTFDRSGIYGRMEGHCYEGMLSAGFAVYFQAGYPWEGHFFAQKVNAQPMVSRLAPGYLSLSGILNGDLAVKGQATEVLRSKGSLRLEPPGVMEIKSIDELLEKMPADWNFVKRDLVKTLLESFRTYNYTKGELAIDYQNADAVGTLRLSGLQGERNFTVNWHDRPHSSEVANSQTKR